MAEDVYELFQRGSALLDNGDFAAAAVSLRKARELEPDKASIREALGRALFHSQRYNEAADEFDALARAAPTNDYAHFCLGRSLQQLGRHSEACRPLAIAAEPRRRPRGRAEHAESRDDAAAVLDRARGRIRA
jgi:Flp pilus assembly protein TadD